MMEPDEIDRKILALFESDGRLSNREVGRKLEISEATARVRIQKLQKTGALRFVLLVHSRVSKQLAGAYVGVNVKPGLARQAANAIADFPGCFFVSLSLGRFNIMCYFSLAERDELYEMVHNSLEKVPGVLEISVREVLRVTKHPFQFGKT